MKKILLKIHRGLPGRQFWEHFVIDIQPRMNVIAALLMIQKDPVTAEGKKTTPIAWECGCLEEACGGCSMLINGTPRQACSAFVEDIVKITHDTTLTLEPLSKFPLVRDLIVDRSLLVETLRSMRNVPEKHPNIRECTGCGCCIESDPNVTLVSSAIHQGSIEKIVHNSIECSTFGICKKNHVSTT